jgi:hypothetical protein
MVGVTPGRAGANTLRIDFAHAEVPVDVHVAATLPSESIGPLRAMLRHTSHPTFVARDLQFPIAGIWSLRIEARRDRFEVYTQTVTIRIAAAR